MPEDCVDSLESPQEWPRGCVLTIGNFDGVHVGHQRILRAARSLADANRCAAVAVTFEPPPEMVLRPTDVPQRITPQAQKAQLLLDAGAERVVKLKTDAKLLAMEPKEFIERIIVRRFAPRRVVEGHNFFFGRDRSGNIETLRRAGGEYGFALHVVEPVLVELPEGTKRVSSTLVRSLVAAGRIDDANRCLGRAFTLYGKVIGGAGAGRLLQFPTANMDPGRQVVPADGVYAGRAALARENFPAAISIGCKPTLGPGKRTIEAFLIGAAGEHYGRDMELSFASRLRGQVRFDSAEALKAQITKDVQHVRELCG